VAYGEKRCENGNDVSAAYKRGMATYQRKHGVDGSGSSAASQSKRIVSVEA